MDAHDELDAPIDLDELTRQALAADPDAPLPLDAVPFDDLGATTGALLPSWYMPAPMGALRQGRRWRRVVAITSITSFVGINAVGLCSTYGWVSFG